MKSIRWKLVFMYLTLVFIVMLISGTFIILRIKEQEINKAEDELKKCARAGHLPQCQLHDLRAGSNAGRNTF